MPKSPVAQPLAEGRVLGNRNQHTPQEIAESAERGLKPTPRAYQIPLARLKPWAIQPRQEMDAESLRELASSIAVSGVLEPLVVRRDPDAPGGYLLIAGHRRLAAAQLVASGDDVAARGHVATLPCLVRDLDDDAAYALSLVENLQRKDLSARELLDAVLHLHQVYGWRKVRIARETGRNESYIGRLINVGQHQRLRSLVSADRLSPTAAGHILRLSISAQDAVIAQLEEGALSTVSVVDVLRFIDNEEAGRDAFNDAAQSRMTHRDAARAILLVGEPDATEGVEGAVEGRALSPGSAHADVPAPSQGTARESVISQSGASTDTDPDSASAPERISRLLDDGTASVLAPRAGDGPRPADADMGATPTPGEGRRVPVKEHTRLIAGAADGAFPDDGIVTGLARDILAFAQDHRALTPGQRARLVPACAALVSLVGPDAVRAHLAEGDV
jgi:ParB/RepB/Spo0J family partition protein